MPLSATNHKVVARFQHRPIVLLMDWHSSHYCPETIRMAAKEKVVLCTLPPHTTHLIQPLDRGYFGPLKVSWCRVCQAFYAKNPGKVFTIYEFSSLFSQAWFQSMTIANVTSSFKATGVFRIDWNAITLPKQTTTSMKFEPEALTVQLGLPYIPLYSLSKITFYS